MHRIGDTDYKGTVSYSTIDVEDRSHIFKVIYDDGDSQDLSESEYFEGRKRFNCVCS